ncbi:TIGR02265 family protein [Vitiosangium sp. GDMCC 1.1324]|uniref:TIGR02265 family protein n=1 Tax=Vitiosangium sp. (strain GDMCC 1.1324) TaxID=2138576 RepID=UPI00130D641B|nr:TIGR02265 family protein [Vitiosangium sp. GDMCC 1.1324]
MRPGSQAFECYGVKPSECLSRAGRACLPVWRVGRCRAGRAVAHGATDFFASSTGRPLQSLLMGNPQRLVDSLPMAYAVGSANSGQCSVAWEAPRRARVLLDRDFFPCAYVEGALTAALEVMGAREPRVGALLQGPLSCEYVLTWS